MGPTVAGSSGDDATYNKLLRRLELEGLQRIRMFTTICMIYAVFWGPLFLTVAFGARASEEGRGLASVGPPKDPASHQVHILCEEIELTFICRRRDNGILSGSHCIAF